MNTQEHLLVCLMEEPTEVIQELVGALEWGRSFRPDGLSGYTYLQKVQLELADMDAIVTLLQREGVDFDLANIQVMAQRVYERENLDLKSWIHLMQTLVRELSLLSQNVSKCLRFSLAHTAPIYTDCNQDRVSNSLAVVQAYRTAIEKSSSRTENLNMIEYNERVRVKTLKTVDLIRVAREIGTVDKVKIHAGTV